MTTQIYTDFTKYLEFCKGIEASTDGGNYAVTGGQQLIYIDRVCTDTQDFYTVEVWESKEKWGLADPEDFNVDADSKVFKIAYVYPNKNDALTAYALILTSGASNHFDVCP